MAVAPVDEAALARGRQPAAAVTAIAEAKAHAVPGATLVGFSTEVVVLAADTVVVHDGEVIGKPRDRAHARSLLQQFSQATLTVVTGVAARRPDRSLRTTVCQTDVSMRTISQDAIEAYVATGTADDKAGGLALQAEAAPFIERIDGCWTNVVGLPLCEVARLLDIGGEPVRCRDRADQPCHRWPSGDDNLPAEGAPDGPI